MRPTDELITELPLELPGQVYRSVMPFHESRVPTGSLLEIYRDKEVNIVLLLETRMRYYEELELDLDQIYLEQGWEVIPFRIEDFGIPDLDRLREVVDVCLERANNGEYLVIHCHAGIGWTGMVAACLAKRALGLNGEEALAWIDQRVPGAPETNSQRDIVRCF